MRRTTAVLLTMAVLFCGATAVAQWGVTPNPDLESAPPATAGTLRLTPEATTVAVAIPSPQYVYERAMHHAKLLAPKDVDLAEQERQMVHEAAAELGLSGVGTVEELLGAMGVAWAEPIGVFVSAEKTAQALGQMMPLFMQMGQMGGMSMQQAPETQEDAEGQQPQGGQQQMPPMGGMMNPAALMPEFAVAVPLTDQAKMQAVMDKVISELPPLVQQEHSEHEVGGYTLHTYATQEGAPDLTYCLTERVAVLASSAEYAKGVLSRIDDPAPMIYGRGEFPALMEQEIATLTYLDDFAALYEPFMEMAPKQEGQPNVMKQMMEEMKQAGPVVTTIGLEPERLDVVTRMDASDWPTSMEVYGEPVVIKRGMALPAQTTAALAFHMSDSYKDYMAQSMMIGMPPEMQGQPEVQQIQGGVKMAMSLIGNSFVVATTGGESRKPGLFLAIEVANVEFAKGSIQATGLTMQPVETYEGVEIVKLAHPEMQLPVEGYLAFDEMTLVAATELDDVKAALTRYREGTVSPAYADLTAGIDPSEPQYGWFFLKGSLVSDTVKPFMAMMGQTGSGPEAQIMDQVGKIIDNVIAVSNMRDGLLRSRMSLRWDEEALAAFVTQMRRQAQQGQQVPAEEQAAAPAPVGSSI